jgi:hypothetical protein
LDSEEVLSLNPLIEKFKINVQKDIVPRMKDIVIDTFLAAKS